LALDLGGADFGSHRGCGGEAAEVKAVTDGEKLFALRVKGLLAEKYLLGSRAPA